MVVSSALCNRWLSSGVLMVGGKDWEDDLIDQMVEMFKAKQVREARKLIIANCRTDEYEEMFRWLYKNVDMFSDNEDKQDEAIVVIRNGMVKHTQVADPEINLSATLIELNTL